MSKTLILWVCCAACFLFLGGNDCPKVMAAGPGDYYFRGITVNDGLSQNLVSAILQDHKGFMWIGTKNGLNLFDGYTFRIFSFDPTDPGSLSDNHITCLYEDPQGRLWVGTFEGGLHLFNPADQSFTLFHHEPGVPGSISHNHILSLSMDPSGSLWVGTNGGGLNRLSLLPGEKTFRPGGVRVDRFGEQARGWPEGIIKVNSLLVDRHQQLWVATPRHIMTLDPADSLFAFRQVPVLAVAADEGTEDRDRVPGSLTGGRELFEDAKGQVWMGNGSGLFRFDSEHQAFMPFVPAGQPGSLRHINKAAVYENNGREEIWVTTGEDIHIVDPVSGSHQRIHPENAPGLARAWHISLYADRMGGMWVGSNGMGISLYDPMTHKFDHADARHEAQPGLSVRDFSIRAFHLQSGGDDILWVGTSDNLLRVDRRAASFRPVHLEGMREQGNRIVFSIREDAHGMLWLGTGAGLVRMDPHTFRQDLFPTGLTDSGGSTEPRVCAVYPDGDEVWVLTPNTLALFHPQTGQFEHYRYNQDPLDDFLDPSFPFFCPAAGGGFWVGTRDGLHHFDTTTRRFSHIMGKGEEGLLFHHVKAVLPDPDNPDSVLWIATGGGGISRLDLSGGSITHYHEGDGLANNMVYGILPDQQGRFWISTNHGLSSFDPGSATFTNYSVSDGLQSNEFNSGAFYRAPSGEMFFGGINGYNQFFPSRIRHKERMVPVVITGFKVLSEMDGEEERLWAWLSGSGKISLAGTQNSFIVEFAALDYAAPYKNRFAYSMTTKGEHWIYLGKERRVTFTNMKPGNYTLKVRGTNNDGLWSDQVALASIVIRPPWWRSPWLLATYLVLGLGLFARLRRYELSRIRLRNDMNIARIETEKLKELDHLKSRFFANISHEFRTPLTLIKGPIEQMLEQTGDVRQKKTLGIMHDNTNRLLQLINQLLDLSRMESGNLRLHAGPGDLNGLLHRVVMSFATLAGQKNIGLHLEAGPELQETSFVSRFYFDADILEKILNNLLSNAMKFTPAGGRITVRACLLPTGRHKAAGVNGAKHEGMLEVSVADTGIGIPAGKLPYIYDRFYQVDNRLNREHEGSGVGLAYVKELVKTHHGSIAVKSEPGRGTVFGLRFPLGADHFSANELVVKGGGGDTENDGSGSQAPGTAFHAKESPLEAPGHELTRPGKEPAPSDGDKPLVLIVEDHPDMMLYIRDSLGTGYHVEGAGQAMLGLKRAGEVMPDLVVSDVMMPGMDGFALCEQLKTNDKTSHIPVILLTALAAEADRINGLENGADDYLVKPFNPRELRARVKNLIEGRKALQARFSGQAIIWPEEASVNSRSKAFIDKVVGVIGRNIGNEFFSVEALCGETGMSQSQLHRKLKALTGQSPVTLIRSIRLHRAMTLIEQDAGSISEIAYMVGFSDPGYFTRAFKALFGKRPSDIRPNPVPAGRVLKDP
jgi:signal transduction histidine kinase/ligand-binding sensor domain-containing protein/DNA-binding response OmpR family regulator